MFGISGVRRLSQRVVGINVLKKFLLSFLDARMNQLTTIWKKGCGQASMKSALQIAAAGQSARIDMGSRGC